MIPTLIAGSILMLVVLTWTLWRRTRKLPAEPGKDQPAVAAVATAYPSSGLLVSEAVLRSTESGSISVWEALETAALPIAVEYHPVTELEITRYRTVPINTSAQQSVVDIVKALDPKSPTLYKVVLPKGAELVKAVGQSGFRGFSRTGGRTAHAVLKPVAVGGALAASWPVFAVAGTVMAVDMAGQRQLRAHQQQVEAILGRQEERNYIDRITDQRSADELLTRAISLMLDGRNPHMELALKSAIDEFHRAQETLKSLYGTIEGLVEPDGKVNYRKLEAKLGKIDKLEYVTRELNLARGAIAIRRKALVAAAAAASLEDPVNPYTALRKLLAGQVDQLKDAEALTADLTARLTGIQLKGGWSVPKAVKMQERIRALAATPTVTESELQFLRTAEGEILQVVAIDDDDEVPEPITTIT
ncbi:hypothetical protein [Nocardioides zhouii]|uniref:Uncharacterized protein n=1 Tax=Nocardioides zhouii TaxID=1168729 RepID=A0A4Q2SKR0_9ACTN|nr:hypothetical protein [Nocardioides zhouii]RYC05743.1 hypothetical protein EUA94_17745 [Nocardioides zhouii]